MTRRIVRVGNRGQVVIPAEIRSSLGIQSGARVCVTLEDACIILEVVSERLVDKTCGMFKGGPSLFAALKQLRRSNKE